MSKETLEAGLKAEKQTIIEYTKYLNLAKDSKNEAEIKLWEHIIKDEEEHVIEFENALKGDFRLLDDVKIELVPEEKVRKNQEIIETFEDRINDVLQDNNIPLKSYRISEEDPHFYVDFDSDEKNAIKAQEVLIENLFKATLVEDEGFYYVHVLRR